MCADDDAPAGSAADDPVLGAMTRRTVLAGMVGVASASFLGLRPSSAAAASSLGFTGSSALTSAMHVHASWSEGTGSWEAQFAQAAALGIDLMYMTDHDFRALAYGYLTSLKGVGVTTSTTGSLASHSSTLSAGTLHMVASSSSSAAASVLTHLTTAAANGKLRTSIAGHRFTLTFGSVRLDAGATFEVRVQMSTHLAHGSRPAGQLELQYQFGGSGSPHLNGSGLVGVVPKPVPANGSQVSLTLTDDVQTLWPDVLAIDNALYQLTFVVTSPRSGSVADVQVSLAVSRSMSDAASLVALQQQVVQAYGPDYPAMKVWPSVEVSRGDPHVNIFGVSQMFPNQAPFAGSSPGAAYDQLSATVHSQGGLLSWNHPFGTGGGAALPQAQQDAARRSVFASMLANDRHGTDLLEVGYTLRGQASTATHLALWDTFSRRGIFVTGTGANDDHAGVHWSTLSNGFSTGMWAPSVQQGDVVAALAAGRAYTFHCGKWAGGELDMLVDGTLPMGAVQVGGAASRNVQVYAGGLPSGSKVEVVTGVVDYAGNDPKTVVAATRTAAQIGASGLTSVSVDASSSVFVRAQVRSSAGAIIGIGNPVWLLREAPPGGIPTSR
jgi:hypothetical protein